MGAIFRIPAITLGLAGVWGLFVCVGLVGNSLGYWGGLIALIFFPFSLLIDPWYEGFAHSNWFPMLLVYGSSVGGTVLNLLAAWVEGDEL